MHAGEALALQSRTGWVVPTLLNSWVAFGAPYHAPAFMKEPSGLVRLRGIAINGTVAAAIFTLPAGSRPSAQKLFPALSNNLLGLVEVFTNGDVKLTSGSNVYVALDGMSFTTD